MGITPWPLIPFPLQGFVWKPTENPFASCPEMLTGHLEYTLRPNSTESISSVYSSYSAVSKTRIIHGVNDAYRLLDIERIIRVLDFEHLVFVVDPRRMTSVAEIVRLAYHALPADTDDQLFLLVVSLQSTALVTESRMLRTSRFRFFSFFSRLVYLALAIRTFTFSLTIRLLRLNFPLKLLVWLRPLSRLFLFGFRGRYLRLLDLLGLIHLHPFHG
ncbi:hypothetical protein FIBSPDRAFT_267689 [Athelia psychrophila]|uniref:Uncharacterized protein n=1 Tax=Athelia psychrophila TaxID=1759441 RepID=A0A166RHA9_9AGAM|nr:hypothetical protein FIBSPDRAFT_267689 [Fibularhizoctonia sp. CBS 109695]